MLILQLILMVLGDAESESPDLRQHLKNLAVSNTKLKEVQMRMMEGEITMDRDPMIEGYEERISGHSFDPENDENTLKAIKNINTPVIIRIPAAPAFYLGAVHH